MKDEEIELLTFRSSEVRFANGLRVTARGFGGGLGMNGFIGLGGDSFGVSSLIASFPPEIKLLFLFFGYLVRDLHITGALRTYCGVFRAQVDALCDIL